MFHVTAVPLSGLRRLEWSPAAHPLQAGMRTLAAELHTITTSMHQVRIQGVSVPEEVMQPDVPQDTMYSLDPQRNGHSPHTFPVLPACTGGHHA